MYQIVDPEAEAQKQEAASAANAMDKDLLAGLVRNFDLLGRMCTRDPSVCQQALSTLLSSFSSLPPNALKNEPKARGFIAMTCPTVQPTGLSRFARARFHFSMASNAGSVCLTHVSQEPLDKLETLLTTLIDLMRSESGGSLGGAPATASSLTTTAGDVGAAAASGSSSQVGPGRLLSTLVTMALTRANAGMTACDCVEM